MNIVTQETYSELSKDQDGGTRYSEPGLSEQAVDGEQSVNAPTTPMLGGGGIK